MKNAVTKRIPFVEVLQRRFRQADMSAMLRGAGRGEGEDGFRAAHRVRFRQIRLRQVPPVIADRVTDPRRPAV